MRANLAIGEGGGGGAVSKHKLDSMSSLARMKKDRTR